MEHEARLVSSPLLALPPSHNGHLQEDLAIWARPSGLYHVTDSRGGEESLVGGKLRDGCSETLTEQLNRLKSFDA